MNRRHFLQQFGTGTAGLAIGPSLLSCRDASRNTIDSAAAVASGHAQGGAPSGSVADRMAWWREARFGMFIHFGLYSILGGEWKGKRAGSHEWIRNNYKIPHEEYIRLVDQFDPTGFDADQWAAAARDAGQKYLVLTTKHHEGFSLWDSRVTTYDVMSTPFKRDIVREVADACRRHDLRIGWYYSIMDWYHPDYLPRRDWETRDATGADFTRYVAFMKAQLRELLTQYGDISILWFDGQWERTWNHHLGASLYEYCRSIAPNVIINDRIDAGVPNGDTTAAGSTGAGTGAGTGASLGAGAGANASARKVGDFTTPEQNVPDTGLPGVDWESCMTMNQNWGYSRFDHDYKSVPELVRLLVDTASRGGNLLLNVGPMGDGRFPQESIDRLKGVGAWMRVNGGAIYGTRATPFAHAPVRVTSQEKRLNLFMDNWHGGTLQLPSLEVAPSRAYLLEDPRVQFETSAGVGGLAITLPERGPASLCPVVVLEFADVPHVAGARG